MRSFYKLDDKPIPTEMKKEAIGIGKSLAFDDAEREGEPSQ